MEKTQKQKLLLFNNINEIDNCFLTQVDMKCFTKSINWNILNNAIKLCTTLIKIYN